MTCALTVRRYYQLSYQGKKNKGMEARPGFEPGSADLQSAAWPLCYRAEEAINE